MNKINIIHTENSNVNDIVRHLKSLNFKTSIIHFRVINKVVKTKLGNINVPVEMPLFEIKRQKLTDKIISRGGYTTCRIWGNGIDVCGEAKCHPNDSFVKKIAVTKSVFQAVAKLSKET